MRRTAVAVAVAVATMAVGWIVTTAGAEEPARNAKAVSDVAAKTTSEQAAERVIPRPAIKVLQHPYDISTFYRSGESSLGPWAGLLNDPTYRISGFYRAHEGGYPSSPHGWSSFWTNGYGAPRPAPFPGYRRTIGENGDLFLLVPYLAPVGPITGALGY